MAGFQPWPRLSLSLNCVRASERLSDSTLLFAWHCGTGTGRTADHVEEMLLPLPGGLGATKASTKRKQIKHA